MNEEDQEEIAQIVQRVMAADHEQQQQLALATRRIKHLRRRVLIVSSVTTVIVATHHFTHIEPIGRIGEMTVGALFSWFFEQAVKRGE